MILLKSFAHILIIIFLTLITQIGGIVWILNEIYFKLYKSGKSRRLKLFSFFGLYLITTLFVVPILAPLNGRTKLPTWRNYHISPCTIMTPLLNRNYVSQKLKKNLIQTAKAMNQYDENLRLTYLDANFPFCDGFPLLPHISHNDGRKVDLSFYYTQENKRSNLKPARSGYGVFVNSTGYSCNQTEACFNQGYWQYDYPKYLTFGRRKDLTFDEQTTRVLIQTLLRFENTDKILIEPHLKSRMKLNSNLIRFQGCRSVRHDDHIHYQIN